ncbi:Phycocyanin [Stanieria cyanosphaera PCC 7437]|uniref:Phycocyanin n=1 Tax=Stanieria cyanosphaera (strain ATCC 29371 / PCC 7437) TaxID=111780 RepID=K9XNJ3_STAC7|nr:phycocyanin [Stanieria cyanosphaera]AFZ34083.1 Phycocyanin [Stanieria cyanosphaera PCC 7437]
MSIITKMIVNADAEIRYLTPGELEQINLFIKNSDRRLKLVKALTESRSYIVKQAANQLFQSRPYLVSTGGNAYGKEKTATCLRDMDYYLRLVSYSIAAGDGAPIQELGIVGVSQMYKSLGTPIDSVAESVRAMKKIATSILSGEDASEVGTYFDYLIAALQ